MAAEIYTLKVTCNMLWYEFKHDMRLTWYEFNKKHFVVELMKQKGNERHAFTSEAFLSVSVWLGKLLHKLT